jgi:phage tail-like protein
MRPSGATFWRIGGLTGWTNRTASSDLAVSDKHGLRLEAAPDGPLSLLSADDSVGGLVLPRGMAFDAENTLYLLDLQGARIKRFNPETRGFAELPEVGGVGQEARRFAQPSNIAIADRLLYVADTGNRRVQVFDLETLVLTEIWDDTEDRSGWRPVDLAEHRGSVYILDSERARLYRRARTGHLMLVSERADRPGQWSRVLVDNSGTAYFLNASRPDHPVLDSADPKAAPISDASAVRDLFTNPALRLDANGRFCLPETLARICDRSLPVSGPAPEMQLGLCAPFNRRTQDCNIKPQLPRTTRTAQGSWLLYVVEREQRRVDAYTAQGRRLRHSWGDCLNWQPSDVAAHGEIAFVLDEQNQAVHRHQAGRDSLPQILRDDTGQRFWSRIALSSAGRIYLYESGKAKVQVYDCQGKPHPEVSHTKVASLFEATMPAAPTANTSGLIFDRQGMPVDVIDPSEPSGTPFYRTSGEWQSTPLDSQKYRCQWHRIELFVANLPSGSKIDIYTYAHQKAEDVDGVQKDHWQQAYTIVAPIQPSACPTGEMPNFEFLVQSGEGQFLSIRIALESDGFSTPAVDTMKVHYPRESYLEFLPATYSTDDESRLFLDGFLAIFGTELDKMEHTIDTSELYFDPDAVPAGRFLEYLARQWLGLQLENTWSDEQKRRLLSTVPKNCPHRGQLVGLRDFLAVYLANIAGTDTTTVQSAGFPVIVEGFRERQHLFASDRDASRLGHGAPLWSAAVVRRLQLGVYSREGEVELVSAGDPDHDVFDYYAHRFRIFLPAGWIRTGADERMLRRAIDAEKPAQTRYDLCLVEPRFRVEAQSTIGLDTFIGEAPVTRLGCACRDLPLSLPPSGRLGYDTVLGASGPGTTMQLTPSTILGRQPSLA